MKPKNNSWTLGSAILAAFAASVCCLGPLLLAGLGVGAAAFSPLVALRPYFLGLSGTLLAAGFYFVYRKPKTSPACEGETCAPDSPARRWAKPILWIATLAVLALAFFPSYGTKLIPARASAVPAAATRAVETAQLRIAGMYCPVCAGLIQKKLSATPGVIRAKVDYPAGSATVAYNPAKIAPSQIVDAVNSTGYKAALSK